MIWSCIACVMLAQGGDEPGPTNTAVYSISTEGITREFVHDTRRQSWASTAIRDAAGHEWMDSRGAPEYALTAVLPGSDEAVTLSSSDSHELVTIQQLSSDRINVRLRRQDVSLELDILYVLETPHSFVSRRARINNTGPTPILVEDVFLENLPLEGPLGDLTALHGLRRIKAENSPRWFSLNEFDGANGYDLEFETGRWRDATWLPIARKSRQEGLLLGWETGAVTTCTLRNGPLRLEVTMRVHYVLEPGESLDVPPVFIGVYEGDQDEGHYAAHRFVEDRVATPRPDDDFPYLMFNSWGYGTAIHDTLAREAIEMCTDLGVEVFVADFGWEGPDWEPLPEAFPEGLAPLADICREKGMKFGLHYAFGNVSEKSKMYLEHPEWVYGEGCWGYGHDIYKVYALSLGLAQAREWIIDKSIEVIDKNKVDWFLTDTHLWGHIDPDKHQINGDQNYLAPTGFETVLDEIRRRRPEVLIEHCDGGLSLANYKMMRQHVTSITCDNADALETRMSVFDLSRFLPPRYLDKYQQEWRSHYANRSCMFGGPWILMMPIHLLERDSADWRELVEDIALYKQYRSRIRDGKVLHLLAPGDPADPNWDGWDAIGSYHPLEDAAILFVFRTRGGNDTRTVPMKVLVADHTYRVRFVDTGAAYVATGSDINLNGIDLKLNAYADDPKSHCSEIVVIEPAAP